MLINCTPHKIHIVGLGDIPQSGQIARVEMVETVSADFGGVPVITRKPGLVTGLPRDARGAIMPCLVSSMVLDALPLGTLNVYAPDTGATAIRENGQVKAVTRLVAVRSE